MKPPVRTFLKFLHDNPGFRRLIAAPPDKTLVYAGRFIRGAWRDLEAMAAKDPEVHDYVILPSVLRTLPPPQGTAIGTKSMHEHLLSLEALEPWEKNGFVAWRAVSGIYASNAVGRVRFYVGCQISPKTKVFAATEIWTLLRNAKLDPLSREIVEYLAEKVRTKQGDINFALT